MCFVTAFLLFNGLTDRRPVFPLLVVFRDWKRYVNLMMGSCRYPHDAFIVGLTKNCTGVSFWQIGPGGGSRVEVTKKRQDGDRSLQGGVFFSRDVDQWRMHA